MSTRRNRRAIATMLGVMAWMAASAALAQAPGESAPAAARTIRVAGHGEVQARPDEARIQLAVETMAATAREAGRENARVMERVIRALVAAGVPREAIETRSYSLFPEYVHEEGQREPRIRGYRAVNQVVLETPQMERVGELIDVALGAGANRLEGIGFGLRDPGAAQREALQAAVRQARASAEALAAALGVRLGVVLDVSTTPEPYRPVPVMMRGRARFDVAEAAAPPTPIQPREQAVQAQVTVVFAIEGE